MDLKEIFEYATIRNYLRIKKNLDTFGMGAMVAVCGIGNIPPRVAHTGIFHTRQLANQILHTPKTATRQYRSFMCHYRSSTWSELIAITFGLHVIAVNEAQRSRVDAVAQTTTVSGTIGEHMSQMAVSMSRANLGANHTVTGITQLIDIQRLDRLSETGPSTTRLELI
jgi:hypothetical protein